MSSASLSPSSVGIAYLSWDSHDHPMDCQKSWFLVCVRERESKTESEQRSREREREVWWKEIVRRYERVRERVSDRVSEMKNIDHHHHHVISISIIIISRSCLPVMGQQWSSDGLPEVVISNLHDVTPNVWLCTYRTYGTLSHVQYVLWCMYETSHQSHRWERDGAQSVWWGLRYVKPE